MKFLLVDGSYGYRGLTSTLKSIDVVKVCELLGKCLLYTSDAADEEESEGRG